jgi:hypothetical protein
MKGVPASDIDHAFTGLLSHRRLPYRQARVISKFQICLARGHPTMLHGQVHSQARLEVRGLPRRGALRIAAASK